MKSSAEALGSSGISRVVREISHASEPRFAHGVATSAAATSWAQRCCPSSSPIRSLRISRRRCGMPRRLAVHRDRVVGEVVDHIGLVVGRVYHRVPRPEGVEETVGEAAVAVGQHAEMPGPLAAADEPRREAVDRHEDRCRSLHGAPVQQRRKRAMERLVDLVEALPPLRVGKSRLPGTGVPSLNSAKAVRRRERPVAVDDEAAVALNDKRRVEQRRQPAATALRRRRPRRCGAPCRPPRRRARAAAPGPPGRHVRRTARRSTRHPHSPSPTGGGSRMESVVVSASRG